MARSWTFSISGYPEADPAVIEADVRRLLAELVEQDLLEEVED